MSRIPEPCTRAAQPGSPCDSSECQVLPHAQTSGLWPGLSHLTLADGLGCVRRHAHIALANGGLHPASSSLTITARGAWPGRCSGLRPSTRPWKPRLQELLFHGEPQGAWRGLRPLQDPWPCPEGAVAQTPCHCSRVSGMWPEPPGPLGDHCPTILWDREPGKELLNWPSPALACSSDVGLCMRVR